MLKCLLSMGADSSFQKNRLILTSRGLEAPDEPALKRILKTFQGDDDETRSQIAFATIIKKINTSESNDNWVYLLKNLIIIDRVVAEQCFTHEVAQLHIPIIQKYVEQNPKYTHLRTDAIIRNHWKLIQYSAKMLQNRRHIIYFPRSQRAEFLKQLSIAKIMQQMESLNQFFSLTFVLANCIATTRDMSDSLIKAFVNFKKTGVISYLLLQLLYKLIAFYTSQMLCVNKVVIRMAGDANMKSISLEELQKFRHLLTRFKEDSCQIISFVERNKDIKGFEVVNYRDLDPMPGNTIIKSIDQYISQKLNHQDQAYHVHVFTGGQNFPELIVRAKPRISGQQNFNREEHNYHQPRKPLIANRTVARNNPFQNYCSNYSEDFPQKEVMTVDLILAIRQEENDSRGTNYGANYEQSINYDARETCALGYRDALPDHLQFDSSSEIDPIHNDNKNNANIYSDLPSVWNFE